MGIEWDKYDQGAFNAITDEYLEALWWHQWLRAWELIGAMSAHRLWIERVGEDLL